MYASLIGRSGSSAFRLSTTAMSMSLAGSRFSTDSAPRPLYGIFLVSAAISQKRGGNGAHKASRQPEPENRKLSPIRALELNREESASLVKRLLGDVQGLKSPDAALAWACQAIGAKNSLTSADARLLDDAFRAKLADLEVLSPDDIPSTSRTVGTQHVAPGSFIAEASNSTRIDKGALSFPEPRRLRDRQHVKYVAGHPCLICGWQPSDPHHLRFAQPPALGRKVSDEFTVPLCRGHHREVHRSSDEIAWWAQAGIDALAVARKLWRETHPVARSSSQRDQIRQRSIGGQRLSSLAGRSTVT